MTDNEKIVLVQNMTDEANSTVINSYLAMAGDAVVNYCDPYGTQESADILSKFGGVQARLAAYWLNKRGAEGESAHSENGISRTYESADIPRTLLNELTPYAAVMG